MRYSVKAAARATGISESRLRTWERRYGIPSPNRSATGRRLYDDADLAVIRRMSMLVDAGMSASDAAEAARASAGQAESEEPEGSRPRAPHPMSVCLFEAARGFDEAAFLSVIEEATRSLGWQTAVEEVLFPGLNLIGSAWQDASISVATEHFASEIVRRELYAAMKVLPLPLNEGPLLLMACPEDERHDLGLAALALLLREQGIHLVYLGADVPDLELIAAMETLKPAALCLSATTASGQSSLARAVRVLLGVRGPRIFVGGPALYLDNVPGIHLPESLKQSVSFIDQTLRS